MASLHLLFSQAAADSCVEVMSDTDTLLLIEDGVYVALTDTQTPMLAIAADVTSRGLASRLSDNIQLIDYADMVVQVARHSPVISWR